MKKNDVMTGRVIDFTHEGHGVVKIDNFPVFIPNAVINELITFKVIKATKKFGIGKLIEIKERSEDRVTPPCEYYNQCGGCNIQHINYAAQLKMKQEQVENLVRKMLKINVPVKPVIGMNNPWRYRNKSQLPVAVINNESAIGFYRSRSHDIVPIEKCLIQKESHDAIMNAVKALINEYNVSIYDEKTHRGNLRHVIIRSGTAIDEVMVVFVTRQKTMSHIEVIASRLMEQFSNVVSIKQNVNTQQTNVIMGPSSVTIKGQDIIHDKLEDKTFEISDKSFYQVNHEQTEKLYLQALKYAGLTGKENVIDAYCGIGTIGIFMAEHAEHVYGVEIVEKAIEDAKKNADNNGLKNTTFEIGKAEDVIKKWEQMGIKPDVVMVDPPRKGIDEVFINTMNTLLPEKIVYVSCNPSTLMRDISLLKDNYTVEEITPVDLFPQTTHVECVALMEKVKK